MEYKKIIAWITLIILITLSLFLSYLKFFKYNNSYIEEYPVENSSANAINIALDDIVLNFNNLDEVQELENNDIKIKAIRNNYSIYISYTDDTISTTYEFNYSNLLLSIKISNNSDNINKFNTIYKLLIKSVQKRLNIDNIDNEIDAILNKESSFEGITIKESDNFITYELNITRKIKF